MQIRLICIKKILKTKVKNNNTLKRILKTKEKIIAKNERKEKNGLCARGHKY